MHTKAYKRVNSREAPGISFPPTSKKNQFHIKEINKNQSNKMFSNSDIFLIAVFGITIVFYEMLSRGVLTMEMIQSIFSGNVNIYIIVAIAIIFFRKYLMRSGDNNLERTVLTLSNELQRMHTEAE